MAKDESPPLIICNRATFYRHYKDFSKNYIVPPFEDKGILIGRPPYIPARYISDLNGSLAASNGEGEDSMTLGARMVDIANKQLIARGMTADSSFPVQSTLDLYNYKAASCDNAVTLVRHASLMHKTVRRQVAGKSVRNCMSHICAIAYAHFVPTKNKYVHPKGTLGGSTKSHKIVEEVTSTFVRPIKNEYVMNTDGTSVYYYAGIAPDDKKSYQWDRVTKDSTLSDNRKKYMET